MSARQGYMFCSLDYAVYAPGLHFLLTNLLFFWSLVLCVRLVEEYNYAENPWLVRLFRWKKNVIQPIARMFSLVAFYHHKELSRQMLLYQRESMPLVGCLIFTIYSVTLLLSGGLRRRTRMWKIRMDFPKCTSHMLAFCSMLQRSIRTTCTKCLRINRLKQ